MKNKYLAIGIVAIIPLVLGGFFIFKQMSSAPSNGNSNVPAVATTPGEQATPTPATTTSPTETPKGASAGATVELTLPAAAPGGITMAEVAMHNSKASCYTTIDGSVYDVTSWIDQHPGGADAILSLCGKDGTAAFADQHGGQRRPANELAGFKIGELAK